MKIAKTLVILLIASIIMSYPISLPSIKGEKPIMNSIQVYGSDAQSFASALQDKSIADKVIIASNDANVDMANILNSITNETTLVAINLPLNNPLTPVPTLQLQKNHTYYKQGVETANTNEMVLVNSTLSQPETFYPKFWITVTKYGLPLSISNFVAMNDTQETRENLIAEAIDATLTTKVHLPGSTPTPKLDSQSNSPLAAALMPPPYFDTTYWRHVAELDYYLSWGTYDFARVDHSIWQTSQYDTVTNQEYWLVSSYFESQFGSYGDQYGFDPWQGPYIQTGPYYNHIRNIIDGDIPYNGYSPLMFHGPGNTDAQGTATLSFNMGVNSDGQGTCAVQYAYSWQVGQNSYDVSASPINAYVEVTENFEGDSKHTNHFTWQTAVFQTDARSGFDISTLSTTWNMGYNVFFLDSGWATWTAYDWTASWNPGRIYGPLDNVPTYTYVSGLSQDAYGYGAAGVDNPTGVIGLSNNDVFARIYAQTAGSVAYLYTALNAPSSGRIIVEGRAQSNYNSILRVYVSSNNYNWASVSNTMVYGTSRYPIDCGTASGFSYVLLVVYCDGSSWQDIYIDSVKVLPT